MTTEITNKDVETMEAPEMTSRISDEETIFTPAKNIRKLAYMYIYNKGRICLFSYARINVTLLSVDSIVFKIYYVIHVQGQSEYLLKTHCFIRY